jgi:hypothetical protein
MLAAVSPSARVQAERRSPRAASAGAGAAPAAEAVRPSKSPWTDATASAAASSERAALVRLTGWTSILGMTALPGEDKLLPPPRDHGLSRTFLRGK